MRSRAILGAMLLALLLLAALPQVAWPQAPAVIAAYGDWVHPASGMTFPASIGAFERTKIHRYDARGLDVSAGYYLGSAEGGVLLTAYVYPAAPVGAGGNLAARRAAACREEFELRRQQVFDVYDGVQVVHRGDAPPKAGATAAGFMGTFEYYEEFFGSRQLLHSELYIYCYVADDWLVKYRITHPKAFDAARHIADFLGGLPWTLRAR
jgi:hypothetical protein